MVACDTAMPPAFPSVCPKHCCPTMGGRLHEGLLTRWLWRLHKGLLSRGSARVHVVHLTMLCEILHRWRRPPATVIGHTGCGAPGTPSFFGVALRTALCAQTMCLRGPVTQQMCTSSYFHITPIAPADEDRHRRTRGNGCTVQLAVVDCESAKPPDKPGMCMQHD